jgi:hypothetical protein
MRRDTSEAKFTVISRHVSPASLLVVSVGYFQRTLVDESGKIRTQMPKHNISEVVAVALCDATS